MSKKHVLFVWERGKNLGHISGLVILSRWVERAGYVPIWIIPQDRKNLIPPELMAWRCITVSYAKFAHPSIRNPVSYAEILIAFGFLDGNALKQAVLAYNRMFIELSPALIVMDSAPLAQLAAYCFGWRAMQISNGFDAPPPDCPAFGFGIRGTYADHQNSRAIARLNQVIAGLEDATTQRNLTLAGFLSAPKKVVLRIPEADPYGSRSDVDYFGPCALPGELPPAAWPVRDGSLKVFAYLRHSPLAALILHALGNTGASILCVCPDGSLLGRGFGANVNIVTSPVAMENVWSEADAIVSYGATTLVCQTLMAGLPQLIYPTDVEKWMVARRITAMGAASVVRHLPDIAGAVSGLYEQEVRATAQRIAGHYQNIDFPQKIDALMSSLLD